MNNISVRLLPSVTIQLYVVKVLLCDIKRDKFISFYHMIYTSITERDQRAINT